MPYRILCLRCNYLTTACDMDIVRLVIKNHNRRHDYDLKLNDFSIIRIGKKKYDALRDNMNRPIFWAGFVAIDTFKTNTAILKLHSKAYPNKEILIRKSPP